MSRYFKLEELHDVWYDAITPDLLTNTTLVFIGSRHEHKAWHDSLPDAVREGIDQLDARTLIADNPAHALLRVRGLDRLVVVQSATTLTPRNSDEAELRDVLRYRVARSGAPWVVWEGR